MMERESVKIPIHAWSSNVARVVCIATSSARIMVLVSSNHVASMKIVVLVGMCTTVAPSLRWPLMPEPSVYTSVALNWVYRVSVQAKLKFGVFS